MDSEKLEMTYDEIGNDVQGIVASPCVGVCQLDPHSGLCLRCLRSLDEISAWSRISPDEQRQVLATVAERRRALQA